MRRLLYIVLLCVGINTHAQQYFNLRETLNSVSTTLTSAHESNNKYYTIGICLDSINYPQGYGYWAIKFAVFDKGGNKLRDTFYQKNGRNLYSWNSKLRQLGDNSLIFAVDAVDTVNGWYLMIYRFDTLGKLLMEKEYLKPVCTGFKPSDDLWRLTDLKPDGYGNWLMLSTVTCRWLSNVHADILLTKLDSSFNVIWHKQYGDPTGKHDVAAKLLVDTGGYVLSGGLDNVNWVDKNFIFQAQLIRTDTAGNIQWTYLSPANRLTNTIQDVIRTQDGGYVYCGQGDGKELFGVDTSWSIPVFRAWAEKIDANRNIVWSKGFGRYYYNTQFTNIHEAVNGDLQLFGSKYYYDSLAVDSFRLHTQGWFMTLNANGDSIKERLYSYLNTCNDVHFINDAKRTTDGGYIMVGEAKDNCYPYNAPTQRAWLIKVDSNGCMSPTDPQCHPTSTGPEPGSPAAVQLYPNPVSGTLFIRVAAGEELSFMLYDLMGRKVREQPLHMGVNEVWMQTLPAGVYVYKLANGKGFVQQGKLVKE